MSETMRYDISEDLKNEIRDDVKASNEFTESQIEDVVIGDLIELRSELWFEQKMVDTLYRKEYKNYLKLCNWNFNCVPFVKLQEIKESIISRGLFGNESLYSSPSKLKSVIYKIYSIHLDLTKNSEFANVLKWVIDWIWDIITDNSEQYGMIFKDFWWFLVGFWMTIWDIVKNGRSFVEESIKDTIKKFWYLEEYMINYKSLDRYSVDWQYEFWLKLSPLIFDVFKNFLSNNGWSSEFTSLVKPGWVAGKKEILKSVAGVLVNVTQETCKNLSGDDSDILLAQKMNGLISWVPWIGITGCR